MMPRAHQLRAIGRIVSAIAVGGALAIVILLAFRGCLSMSSAQPAPPPPRAHFNLGDADRPLPFRSSDGREWCPTPVTSLAWTVCP